ncbi:hypothetical protein DFQ28_011129 [Apophysomyces sp. BC1034]|nr:hypothetical protein DFQ28_011129 [Apophysomyces sp. BC1034]
MNPFTICVRPHRQPIRLDPEDDDDSSMSCFPFFWRQRIQLHDTASQTGFPFDDDLEHVISHDSDNEGDFFNHNVFNKAEPQQFLSRKPFATTLTREELAEAEDAQFLSDHRISTLVADKSKINYNEPSSQSTWQELSETVAPPTEDERGVDKHMSDEQDFRSQLPKTTFEEELVTMDTGQVRAIPADAPVASSPVSITQEDNVRVLHTLPKPPARESSLQANERAPHPRHVISDFPVVSLPRTPFTQQEQPRQPGQLEQLEQLEHPEQPERSTSYPQPTKRPSVTSLAQTLLGDKLDDFTGKWQHIKKNMSLSLDEDSDDDRSVSLDPQHNTSHSSFSQFINQLGDNRRRGSEQDVYSSDDDDFDLGKDLGKVFALGKKNVQTLSEDVKGFFDRVKKQDHVWNHGSS